MASKMPQKVATIEFVKASKSVSLIVISASQLEDLQCISVTERARDETHGGGTCPKT